MTSELHFVAEITSGLKYKSLGSRFFQCAIHNQHVSLVRVFGFGGY